MCGSDKLLPIQCF